MLINVRRLNFHVEPNTNIETTLMNVEDQRCFNIDLFTGSYTYNLFKGNHFKERKTIEYRIILLHKHKVEQTEVIPRQLFSFLLINYKNVW